eukprot:1188595-Prorocentrum_minimum.AAC.1
MGSPPPLRRTWRATLTLNSPVEFHYGLSAAAAQNVEGDFDYAAEAGMGHDVIGLKAAGDYKDTVDIANCPLQNEARNIRSHVYPFW